MEFVFNLLAPDEPDRYFEIQGEKHSLVWQGEYTNCRNAVWVDEYQEIQIELLADPPASWWIVPIKTVTQSEEGFEAIYQGSSILPHWPVLTNKPFRSKVALKITRLRK